MSDDGMFVILRCENGKRPSVLCYAQHEFMASDAVDEYALSAFFQHVGADWKPPATSPEASPLLLEEKDWADGAWPGGGRIEQEDIAEVDGDFGALVRIVPPNTDETVEFYYTIATPYIKEDLLQVTPTMHEFEEVMRQGGTTHIVRGGDLVKGTLAEQAIESGLMPGPDGLPGQRRSANDFE